MNGYGDNLKLAGPEFVAVSCAQPDTSHTHIFLPGSTWLGARVATTTVNTRIIDKTQFGAIQNGINRISVVINGSSVSTYFNGQFLYSTNLPPASPVYGGIGLSAYWETGSWFDDVVVREIGMLPHLNDALLDYDGDGISNIDEFRQSSHPLIASASSELVLHYSFDSDESGIVADLSGYGHTGTVFGASWISNSVSGGGLVFDGNGDWIDVVDTDALDLAGTPFSLSVWVKSTYAGQRQSLFYKMNPTTTIGSKGYVLALMREGGFVGQIDDNQRSPAARSAATTYQDGEWHHVVFVRDTESTNLVLYVDGVMDAVVHDNVTSSIASGHNLRIGRFNSGSESWLNGELDGLKIYRVALNSNEVSAAYAQHTAPPTSDLVLHYRFDSDESRVLAAH